MTALKIVYKLVVNWFEQLERKGFAPFESLAPNQVVLLNFAIFNRPRCNLGRFNVPVFLSVCLSVLRPFFNRLSLIASVLAKPMQVRYSI